MNVTRSSPSYSCPEDASRRNLLSSNPLPSSSSLSSGVLDPTTLHASEATPEIERWRSSISNRAMDDNRSRHVESVDGPARGGASRVTSLLSSNTDHHSAMTHAYTAGVGVYGIHSNSSLSLSSPQHANRRTRELPCTAFSGPLLLFPWTVFGVITYVPSASQTGLTDEPPPLTSPPVFV
ncbi:hypothetical protein EI94DRAFT_1014641 [Lactarius quietus]|nr:hypothetical protein EI94DRAFT_1014641 [Lactarius quietus]